MRGISDGHQILWVPTADDSDGLLRGEIAKIGSGSYEARVEKTPDDFNVAPSDLGNSLKKRSRKTSLTDLLNSRTPRNRGNDS